MGNYDEELSTLEKKKQSALYGTKSQSQDQIAAPERMLLRDEQTKTSLQKDEYKNAYRQILEHDFTSEAWINKKKGKRKHRKNINSNYKTVTGKKWTGLSSDEKILRKEQFEGRRKLSLKAAGLVADLLTDLNKNETFGHDEDLAFLKDLKDMDRSAFDYEGKETDDSPTGADEVFLKKFETNMPLLHRAQSVYEKLFDEDSFPELEGAERMNLMAKLAYMKEVRSAYEDRIRIISSPYYVSLREKDFVGNAPENLDKLKKSNKNPAPLREYAASVLRWRNKGLSLLQEGTKTDIEIGRIFLEADINSRKKADPLAADRSVDGLIGKLGVNSINKVLNDKHDTVAVGMSIKTARNWVYSDLNKKISKKDITARLEEMQNVVTKEIELIRSDPEKYRKDKEESRNKDFKEKKKTNPDIKYRVVTKDDVDIELKRKEYVKAHLANVSKQFAEGEISVEVMKLWLDRGLQYDLRMGRDLYDGIVLQKYKLNRESDESYKKEINKLIGDYFNELPGGIVTPQNAKVSYVREQDYGKVSDKKALYKRTEKYPELLGVLPEKSDFIHIIGGNANSNDITTRAYISAKQQFKSKAVELFMKTVNGSGLKDKIYFKIVSKAPNGHYGMDDITIFFTSSITTKEQKKFLDDFYAKCNEGGQNILDGKDMCVTCTKYKDGIALAPEPSSVETMNSLFLDDSKFNNKNRLKDASNRDDKVRSSFSFNTFVTSMFCQSAITANYMMGKRESANINVADKKTQDIIKKVFRQMCFLNGVKIG